MFCANSDYKQYSSMLRSLVTDLTPPIILRPAQTLWRRARGLGAHTFEGAYKTLADVPCGEGKYDDDALAESIASSLEKLRTPDPHPTFDGEGRSILPVIVGQICEPTTTVLDFGGGPCTGPTTNSRSCTRFRPQPLLLHLNRNTRVMPGNQAPNRSNTDGALQDRIIR